ncbi:MAG: ATP-dependent RNA helicase HrpA [Verrucomicrobiota bacterium]|nr:ATP-dependent RNA helicase HrpA [Verrucomicrobiota bacterium]
MERDRIEELKRLLPQCMLRDWVRLGSRLVRLLRDERHPERHDALLSRLLEEAERSRQLREERRRRLPQVSYQENLPISSRRGEIVEAIKGNQVVVIAGETGSGKTTQIPKMCLEAGLGIGAMIGCTQPRRVAALSISKRIAEELNVEWGAEVGCKIRFDDRSSERSYIKLMTDGILLAETQGDRNLSEYEALIIDEAHERSLNIDFLLGYLKGLLERRRDLKLIVTSATIDTEAFSKHFGGAPIIEVSGRTYPVNVVYEEPLAEEEELHYVDGAVQAAERVLIESDRGDLLIFMPSERDIRETAAQLEGRFSGEAEIIPLFGRLSSGDQQRVFAASVRRKVVVATNIAETSLTIPGVRYVIDSGLARISRYNPRTRTKRLPIEPISQSSANQRKGRAGRVEDGTCIRLYSEQEFAARPLYSQPEIQRANLAEVILRMKAFRLGEIETFPFLQPPTGAAIATGYTLLQELGALDEDRELTELGRDLARLPIDPTLARMLRQAQEEHAIRELLIIAAGLSVQDPRERPLEEKAQAETAHQKFSDARSDFLGLLKIWEFIESEWERARTQNQRRKLCKQHYLSYTRIREWQDLHGQLEDALEEIGGLHLNESNAAYEAIHRSILAGLVGHVAKRQEKNSYKGAGNRNLAMFPGSSLHERSETQRKKQGPEGVQKKVQPEWIVAGEIVETSQVFARTTAGILPEWIVSIAPHCCKTTHHHPRWNAAAGKVLVDEVVTIYGLEVVRRKAAYGNINAVEATKIFVRTALVEEQIAVERRGGEMEDRTGEPEIPAQYEFMRHNRAVRQKVENWQTRVRRYDLGSIDDAMNRFYLGRIQNISSVPELNRFLRGLSSQDLLKVSEADLTGGEALSFDAKAFPDAVVVSGQPTAVSYAYAPGEEHDGVTIHVPFTLAGSVSPAMLEWAVPGLREEKAGELLRALPKAVRRELMPLQPKAKEIAEEFRPAGASFLRELSHFIKERYCVEVPHEAWPEDPIPAHLKTRVAVVAPDGKTLGAGRKIQEVLKGFETREVTKEEEPKDWQRACERWERFDVRSWSFGDLPEKIMVKEGPGLPVFAWPGLKVEEGRVCLRLFRTEESARKWNVEGVKRLVELALQKDFGWLEKELRGLSRVEHLYAALGTGEELRETALSNAREHVLEGIAPGTVTGAEFQVGVERAREKIPGLAQRMIDQVTVILEGRQQVALKLGMGSGATHGRQAAGGKRVLVDPSQLSGLSAGKVKNRFGSELDALVPKGFLAKVEFKRLTHLPRYLKALLLRMERASVNPGKDEERAKLIVPYAQAWRELQGSRHSGAAQEAVNELRWMIEEYKVSLFAQELGTAFPVSPKRLDDQLKKARDLARRE